MTGPPARAPDSLAGTPALGVPGGALQRAAQVTGGEVGEQRLAVDTHEGGQSTSTVVGLPCRTRQSRGGGTERAASEKSACVRA